MNIYTSSCFPIFLYLLVFHCSEDLVTFPQNLCDRTSFQEETFCKVDFLSASIVLCYSLKDIHGMLLSLIHACLKKSLNVPWQSFGSALTPALSMLCLFTQRSALEFQFPALLSQIHNVISLTTDARKMLSNCSSCHIRLCIWQKYIFHVSKKEQTKN